MQKTAAPQKILRARAYVRVSYVGKGRQDTLLSDAMQLDEARRYAEYQGLSFDEEGSRLNADVDVSGFRKSWRQRPGLMHHFEAAQRGEFEVLIFFKISRLARNVREALDVIEAFERLGVAFHFVAERIDSTSAQGRFLRNVLLAAAEMQSEDAAAFLKATFERRARDGKVHGATPVWIRQTGPGLYELIPEQVAAIRRIVELRMSGLGYQRIARQLNQEGFRTTEGKYWTNGMAFKYLQASWIETMQGTSFYGRGTENPIRIPNAFPALLSAEEAERLLALQELYSEEYRRNPVKNLYLKGVRKNGRYSASTIHLVSSILFCPQCGARMTPFTRGKNDGAASPHRYMCTRAKTQPDMHTIGLNSIGALSIEDAVLRVMRGVLIAPPKPIEERSSKPTKSANELQAVQGKIDRLVTMHLDGKIATDDYNRVYPGLVCEKERLMELHREEPTSEHHRQLTELAAKENLSRAELRQLVLLFVERIDAPIVMDGVTIRRDRKTLRRMAKIKLRFPTANGESEFLAPLYESDYQGHRRFIAVDGPVPPNYASLIGERPRER